MVALASGIATWLWGMNMELRIDELLQIAGSKRWTIWTISMIPWTAQQVISGSPLCTPLVEKLYSIPRDLLGENDRLVDLLRRMNQIGGWPPEIVIHQSQLLDDFRSGLPSPTVHYAGHA